MEQAAGLARLEYIAKLEGVKLFDMDPIYISRLGTPKDPIIVQSVDENRYVGCTGFPSDSHELLWINVTETKDVDRCPECGCCFRLAPYEYSEIGKVLEEA
ncbi:Cytochrome c oxidase subunit 4 [Coelomomyces lativittatus]|nr:Cytochrome c oxidase subunit 4 [Coelomomyces lativittatus]